RPVGAWGSFEVSKSDGGNSALDKLFGAAGAVTYRRRATTIDEYSAANSIDRVDLVKIDVDGPGLAILRGASETLARCRPAIIVEAGIFNRDHGVTFEELFEFLQGYGYEVFGSARTADNMFSIKTPADLPDSLLNDDIDLFCGLPGVHRERWQSLWF